MRVIYFAYEYYCGHGAQTHARQFFQALAELEDVESSHIFPPPPEPVPLGGGEASGVHPSGPKRLEEIGKLAYILRPKTGLLRDFLAATERHDIDTVIIRASEKFTLVPAIKKAAPHLTLCTEVNAALFDEEFENVPFRRVLQQHEVNCIDRSDLVMTVSGTIRKYLAERGLDERKCFVCPNGVDPRLFRRRDDVDVAALRSRFGVPEGAFLVGYVGGMEPFRRLPEVIRRFADVRRKGVTDMFLLLVGDGSDKAAVERAVRENSDALAGWVHLEGWQPHEEVPRIMQSLDLAIFPFANPYQSPLKIFEYLAMGLPVIGPDVPSSAEVFESGRHLLLVSQTGDDFERALMSLRKDPGLRARLAEAGRAHVVANYTWKKNAEQVLDRIRDYRRDR